VVLDSRLVSIGCPGWHDSRASPKAGLQAELHSSSGDLEPVVYIAAFAARIRGSAVEPLVTVDGIKMTKTFMFFSSEKAKKAIGYSPRPGREALADAVEWLRVHKL
jgi:nucleoside-diphosphate-sugar epimerase